MTDRFPRFRRFVSAFVLSGAVAVPTGCGVLSHRWSPAPQPNNSTVERGQAQPALVASSKRPSAHSTRVGQYVFHTDFPLDTTDPLFAELEALPEQIERELKLPTGANLIHVYLFDDEERYHTFLRAKDRKLPLRSAYFFAEPGRGYGMPPELHVYTWTGPRLKIDLRHELTHALLHGTLKGVPLWLDEGLAGFFEQPLANDGVNVMHLDALRNGEVLRDGPFRGDLNRLERLGAVNEMGRPEYQEAWAWVHFLLRGNPKARRVLLDHLQVLRATSNAGPLMPKLEAELGDPTSALLAYLSQLDLPTASRVRSAGR
jgi:hypothetical protein